MTIRQPTSMTARELAEILTSYGDTPMAIGLVDGDDYASLLATNIRPEMTGIRGGTKVHLALVGYLNDDETFKEQSA